MKKTEFRKHRLGLDISVVVLSEIIGFSPRAIRDWENPGCRKKPHPAAVKIMERLIEGWRPPEFKIRAWYGRTNGNNFHKKKASRK